MASRLIVNNASEVLAADMADTDTSLTLAAAGNFPALSGGNWIIFTIQNAIDPTIYEICKATARTGAVLSSITRAQEGTVALNWVTGDIVEIRETAQLFNDKANKVAIAGDVIDFGDADSLEIPNSSAPTLAAGQIALDTSVTDYADGLFLYKLGSVTYAAIAIPLTALASPTDTYVVTYDAGTDKFKLAAGGSGGMVPADILGTSNQITSTDNLDGTATLSLPTDVIMPGTGGVVIPAGDTASRRAVNYSLRINTDTLRLEYRVGGSYSGIQLLWDADFSNGILAKTGALTYSTATFNGTTNRISVTGGGTSTITYDISASYAGQTSITTLGTISTGTWNADPIATAYIANSAITYAKIQNVSATSRILGRKTAGAGVVEELTAGDVNTILGISGTNTGDQTSIVGITGTKAQFNTAVTSDDLVFTSDLGTNVATFLATPSSANLAAAITNETGNGALVFGTSPALTTPVITGISDASAAGAGIVGQIITNTTLSTSATTNVALNATSISLTAGHWAIVDCSILTVPAGSTTTQQFAAGINTVSATMPSFYCGAGALPAGIGSGMVAPPILLNISSTTTVYLVAYISFLVSTMQVHGKMTAVRIR